MLILLQLHKKLPKNSTLTILESLDIWSKLERWKCSIWGSLMSWSQVKKNVVLKYHFLLFYATTVSHFSIWLWYAMKSGFYMTTSNDQLSGWTKKKLQGISQSQNSTNKRSLTLFGGLLPICSTITFWFPVKPLYLRSMLSTSMRCSKTCNTCSQHWSTGRVLFLSTTVPDHTAFKSWTNWVTKFCLICHIRLTSSQLTTLFQASQQHFAVKILLYPTGGRKCFPRVQQILKHGFLCYRKKQTYFSLAKKCWL